MPESVATHVPRAIYLDIESLGTDPPDVAILGILTGSAGEDLAQLIVDPRLAPARVAKRERLRVAGLDAAVRALIQQAVDEDRRLIGWSNFDRDRLIDACPALAAVIGDRYVNALEIGRPWRNGVHPGYRIERANRFSPRHTLDQYARLANYERADALVDATPAEWIRHVLEQLEARGGRYRRITPEARRDWHQVLEYNRHDLLALRHIVLTAVRELELWRAYQGTCFCVDDHGRKVRFKAGSKNARLDALLRRHSAMRWAFITAWNPGSRTLSKGENSRRHEELRAAVSALGLQALEGEGIGEGPSWHPERSLFVLNISRGKAVSLGRRFGQLAIVVGRCGEPSRLVPVTPPHRALARRAGHGPGALS